MYQSLPGDDGVPHYKKRKFTVTDRVYSTMDNQEHMNYSEGRSYHCEPIAGRHFIHLRKSDNDSIFQTEEWQPSGSTLFYPLTEDMMINTRNIDQISCSRGSFFVAGLDGRYSRALNGEVIHFWRFCWERKKLFICQSFLFQNPQDYSEVQQVLQKL